MKNKWLKSILTAVSLAAVLAIGGCGQNTETASDSAGTEASEDAAEASDTTNDDTASDDANSATSEDADDAGSAAVENVDDELSRILEEGVLKVGVEGTYPPVTYHDEDGELTGFDIEVAQAIGEKLGVEVEFVEAEWDSLLLAIDSGRIDTVINAVSVTDERKEKYDFTEPYVSVYYNVIVKADNDSIQSLEDLDGKKAGENITSAFATRIEELGAEIVVIDSLQQAIDLVTTGRADFTLTSDILFYPYLEEHPDADVKIACRFGEDKDQFAIPFKKGETRLVDAVNQALDELKADGTLSAISEKYFNSDVIEKASIE